MDNVAKIFAGIFILISFIVIIFFCPVTVTVQQTTKTPHYNKSYSPYGISSYSTTYSTANNSYSYGENRRIWEVEDSSGPHTTQGFNPTLSYITTIRSSKINFGKLMLEEFCVLGCTFIAYLITKCFWFYK